jgi:hypothetical protein
MATTTMIANIKKEIMTFSTTMNSRFDKINANLANLDGTLNRTEHAHPKEDAANDFSMVIDGWARKFQEFFNRSINSPSATDPIPPENNML